MGQGLDISSLWSASRRDEPFDGGETTLPGVNSRLMSSEQQLFSTLAGVYVGNQTVCGNPRFLISETGCKRRCRSWSFVVEERGNDDVIGACEQQDKAQPEDYPQQSLQSHIRFQDAEHVLLPPVVACPVRGQSPARPI